MPDAATFAVFAAASLALTLVPGPAVFYIIARGVEGGRPAGLVSVLGITTGGLLHTVFAAVGLSAILASSATAFSVVKWAGVAYLVYLGLRRILTRDNDATDDRAFVSAGLDSLPRIFWQGVLVDLLNPKVALFFLAFLPQFVDPSRGPAWIQILALGLTLAVVGLCTDGLYALLSGTAADWLKRKNDNASFRRLQRYFSGGVYLALGAGAAASGSGKN